MSDLQAKNKIVFIIGHPRSGTTWLMWLLAQHPAVASCNHAGFFHALEPLQKWWKAGTKFGKTIHVLTRADPSQVEPDYERVKLNHLLERDEFAGLLAPAARAVFTRITAAKPGATVAVEQTPENMLFVELIRKMLPGAYFLHILRDPRAVAASMRKAVRQWAGPDQFPYHPVQITESWLDYMQRGEALEQEAEHYCTVRYEDLRSGDSMHLQGIFEWLGLDTSPELCSRYMEASTIDRMRAEGGLMPKGFFQRGLARGWSSDLKRRDIEVIEYLAGGWMERLGYETSIPRTGGKPRGLAAYERGSRWRSLTRGGFWATLRRLFGGNRVTRTAARWLRTLRRMLSGMDG